MKVEVLRGGIERRHGPERQCPLLCNMANRDAEQGRHAEVGGELGHEVVE
jgi:hypothetical protein